MTVAAGYDCGWAKGGVGVVGREGNRLYLLHRALIVTKPDQPEYVRAKLIWSALAAPVLKYHPIVFGIEDQSGVSTAARVRTKRALAAAARGGKIPGNAGFNASNDNVIGASFLARGVALAYGVRYKLLQPQSIKRAVLGKGGSAGEKSQMIAAIKAIFPELNAPGVKLSEHEADAIATAILALRADLVLGDTRDEQNE